MDFGLARTVGNDGMTQTGTLVGTMEYMSPEQALAQDLDQRSDLFTLGLILYEMLTGVTPFRAESAVASLIKRNSERAVPVSDHDGSIPRALSNIVSKCLERDPNLRYQSATELLLDLRCMARQKRGCDAGFSIGRRTLGTHHSLAPGHGYYSGSSFGDCRLCLSRATVSSSATKSESGPAVSLAILPFRNLRQTRISTGWDRVWQKRLSTDVGQSSHLRIVSPERVSQVLRDLRISPDTSLDSATVQRLAEFSNADNVVWGRYTRFGDQIRIDATIQDMKHGHNATLAESATENNILSAIDLLAGDIRSNLALSRSTVKELQGQSFKPSTNSLAAMRDYDDGLQLGRRGQFPRCEQAIRGCHERGSAIRTGLLGAGENLRQPGPGRRRRARFKEGS